MSLSKRSVYFAGKQSATAFKQKMFNNKNFGCNSWFSIYISDVFLTLRRILEELSTERVHVSSWKSFIDYCYKSDQQQEKLTINEDEFAHQMNEELEIMKKEELNKIINQHSSKYPPSK
jgi:hypothetical protein